MRLLRNLAILVMLGNIIGCENKTKLVGPEIIKRDIHKCYGDSPCMACTSCNYCKWCKEGGTCGICISTRSEEIKEGRKLNNTSKQCMAITKKGRRCTRRIRSGNYCW